MRAKREKKIVQSLFVIERSSLKLGKETQIYCKGLTSGEGATANRKLQNLDAICLAGAGRERLLQRGEGRLRCFSTGNRVRYNALCSLVRSWLDPG